MVSVEEWFTAINPNAKIPAIVDQKPLGGKTEPLTVFESAAILIYLADKIGKFLATNGTRQRYETLEWLMWEIGGIGPTLVQSFYFYKMAKERFMTEAKRLLTILDTQLAKTKTFVSGTDYTIADIAIYHWTVHFSIQYQDQFEQNKYSYKLLRDLMRVRVCGYCY
jgi:GST-like protein